MGAERFSKIAVTGVGPDVLDSEREPINLAVETKARANGVSPDRYVTRILADTLAGEIPQEAGSDSVEKVDAGGGAARTRGCG